MRLLDNRSRYTESYGRNKLPAKGVVTIQKCNNKVLVFAVCGKCGIPGMAYEDANNPSQKKHYCMRCRS